MNASRSQRIALPTCRRSKQNWWKQRRKPPTTITSLSWARPRKTKRFSFPFLPSFALAPTLLAPSLPSFYLFLSYFTFQLHYIAHKLTLKIVDLDKLEKRAALDAKMLQTSDRLQNIHEMGQNVLTTGSDVLVNLNSQREKIQNSRLQVLHLFPFNAILTSPISLLSLFLVEFLLVLIDFAHFE